MPSEIRSIGPTIRRMAKGTIDLVRWRAPVQLLKYATRTVWLKNVNIYTGYPVDVFLSLTPTGRLNQHIPADHLPLTLTLL